MSKKTKSTEVVDLDNDAKLVHKKSHSKSQKNQNHGQDQNSDQDRSQNSNQNSVSKQSDSESIKNKNSDQLGNSSDQESKTSNAKTAGSGNKDTYSSSNANFNKVETNTILPEAGSVDVSQSCIYLSGLVTAILMLLIINLFKVKEKNVTKHNKQ